MITILKDFFSTHKFDFTLVFGSYASGDFSDMSDIDIGIYTKKNLPLQELGYISVMLEEKLKKRVDIVSLYKIEQKDPNFAFSILKQHKLILCDNKESYINFKTSVQLSYLDHKELIEQNLLSLKKRIESGNFARRNFA